MTSSYGEGERVFGPPSGTYDADWVAAAARRADPGLPPETAVLLAGRAWELLRSGTAAEAPELARALLAGDGAPGATACNVVATAAVSFVTTYGVTLD